MSHVLQTTVPANTNNAVLQNLDPDTPYNIKVTAIYGDGPGGELEGNGRTGTAYPIHATTWLGAASHVCRFS